MGAGSIRGASLETSWCQSHSSASVRKSGGGRRQQPLVQIARAQRARRRMEHLSCLMIECLRMPCRQNSTLGHLGQSKLEHLSELMPHPASRHLVLWASQIRSRIASHTDWQCVEWRLRLDPMERMQDVMWTHSNFPTETQTHAIVAPPHAPPHTVAHSQLAAVALLFLPRR